MPRRGLSDDAKQAAALRAGRQMIARGDRPAYRVRTVDIGRWTIDAMPWIIVTAPSRREALDEALAAIAGWLDVSPDTFDVDS